MIIRRWYKFWLDHGWSIDIYWKGSADHLLRILNVFQGSNVESRPFQAQDALGGSGQCRTVVFVTLPPTRCLPPSTTIDRWAPPENSNGLSVPCSFIASVFSMGSYSFAVALVKLPHMWHSNENERSFARRRYHQSCPVLRVGGLVCESFLSLQKNGGFHKWGSQNGWVMMKKSIKMI